METKTQEPQVVDRLEKLGFSAASAKVKELSLRKRKMAVAYEHYRFVRPEKIDAFNEKLRKMGKGYEYKRLIFTLVERYEECPPPHVLDALELAKSREVGGTKVFDYFSIAHIVDVKDPILFGEIVGCSDRFFIDQWDDDVKIEDILSPNEG